MNLLQATENQHLFARGFRKRETWDAWFAFLSALFALPMTDEQLATFKACTGRSIAPTEAATEAFLVCGRRGGKSQVLALLAVWFACFRDYRPFLNPGERCTIVVVAADRKQARTIMRYVRALLKEVPSLEPLLDRELQESFDLTNNVTIEVHTASFKSVRGYTVGAAILDELAFFRNEDSANPDEEILAALRPAMSTIPGAMLLGASSPYARRGALWNAYAKHYGKDGDPILVWQAPTRTMNPTVPLRVIEEAYERDPASADAEYGANFRKDISALLTKEAIEACVSPHIRERAPIPQTHYVAFVDPSGGSADSMTLAIGHLEDKIAMIDAIREAKPPFKPTAVVKEFADLLKRYRVRQVIGDRYAGEWPREAFAKHGITYLLAPKTASELYLGMLASVNSQTVALLDNATLINQLQNLKRRTSTTGKDTITHPPHSHDDVANAVSGVAHMILVKPAAHSEEDVPSAPIILQRRTYNRDADFGVSHTR